jgi:polyferredoxin
MTKIKRVQPFRRIAAALQALILIGLPFVRISGDSALRFDIPSLRLFFFGTILSMDEFFIVLIALVFVIFLIVLVTLLFGRIWCGWVCPQTVLVDFTRFVDRAFMKGIPYKITSYGATFFLSVLVAATLIWYFVSPYEFFARLAAGGLGKVIGGFWIVLSAVVFLDLALLRQRFCATICPYAKLQSVLFDDRTLVIAFDPDRKEECMNCMACVKTCPVGIDIREGLNAACINCAECIDKCTDMMSGRKRSGLIGYFFGLPGSAGKILRQNVVLIVSIAALFFAFFVYLSFSRTPVGLTVLPNYDFAPRVTGGEAVNAYILSVENRGRAALTLSVSAEVTGKQIRVVPDTIHVEPGELNKVRVFAVREGVGKGGLKIPFRIVLKQGHPGKTMAEENAYFIIPEEPK